MLFVDWHTQVFPQLGSGKLETTTDCLLFIQKQHSFSEDKRLRHLQCSFYHYNVKSKERALPENKPLLTPTLSMQTLPE